MAYHGTHQIAAVTPGDRSEPMASARVGENTVAGSAPPGPANQAYLFSLSARTLILGVDQTGGIVQYDRSVPGALGVAPDDLLGSSLSDLVAGAAEQHAAVAGLLDAIGSDRENTVMLAIKCNKDSVTDEVVTVQPICTNQPGPAALVVIRIAPSNDQRFTDPALMRRALLDDSFTRIGATLDLDQMGRGLVNVLVPHFCNAGSLLVLESLVGDDEFPVHAQDAQDGSHQLLRRIAIAYDDANQAWDAAFPTGEVLRYPPGSMYVQCMDSGKPVREVSLAVASAYRLAEAWRRAPVADLPGSKLIEVGGDWYESIALPGARVALVVGDVAGHGVLAAVTMGRLRAAIQTLARLELSPAESL